MVPAAAVILQVSPTVPSVQGFDGGAPQVLAGPTHLLVSTQGLLDWDTLHG
jgi:hypothetical protein